MTQAGLDAVDFKIILNEDQIKKEPVDACLMICSHCEAKEEIDIQSLRNTTPFTCFSCEIIDDSQVDHRTWLSWTSTTTTQTRSIYFMHLSYPETIVTTMEY